MAYPRKHSNETRERIRELNAAGHSDREISRILGGVPTPSCVRQIRKRLNLPQHFTKPTTLGDTCAACGVKLTKYRPLCMDCWKSVPSSRRFAIGTNLRWRKREDVERMAAAIVRESKKVLEER